MFNIGFKIWSINTDNIVQIRALYERNMFHYLELYFVPDTLQDIRSKWSLLKEIPFVLHAPHFEHGVNFADKDLRLVNRRIMDDVFQCADILRTDTIIVHGGNGGSQEETIKQLKSLQDLRIIIENKPRLGINGKECIGYSPEGIAEIVRECGFRGFVLDFNHAVCTANFFRQSQEEILKSFSSMFPIMFHLSDGQAEMIKDIHLNLGKGSLELKKIISMIPAGKKVTLETPRRVLGGFQDFVDDVIFIEKFIRGQDFL